MIRPAIHGIIQTNDVQTNDVQTNDVQTNDVQTNDVQTRSFAMFGELYVQTMPS
jgi:hypothetical protein